MRLYVKKVIIIFIPLYIKFDRRRRSIMIRINKAKANVNIKNGVIMTNRYNTMHEQQVVQKKIRRKQCYEGKIRACNFHFD